MSKINRRQVYLLSLQMAQDKDLTPPRVEALRVAAEIAGYVQTRSLNTSGKRKTKKFPVAESKAQELYEKASQTNGHQKPS